MYNLLKKEISFLIWTLIGVLLFSLSFPGLFNSEGIPGFAFFALFPLYLITGKMNYREAIFWGFTYGAGTYLLFNYWIKEFDPVSFTVLPTIMGLYHILLFIFVVFIYRNVKRFNFIPLSLSWVIYELFKGENSIGYTYGTLGHSMYRTHIFTGIADITGVYILSLLIVFPAIYAASLLNREEKDFKEIKITSLVYIIIIIIATLYTVFNRVDYSESSTIKTSLIQHNIDNWAKGSNSFYKDNLDNLMELSKEAEGSDPDLVIWSETAFIPAIEWHKQYKSSSFRLNLVNRMEEFFATTDSDYLIGANETLGFKSDEKEYYNSAYIYQGGDITGKYRKVTLVPFTEYFPYPKLLPSLHKYLQSIGSKDLLSGTFDQENFHTNNIEAAPLICYEDTFSTNAAIAVRKGADLLVNLTNDAWSDEPACTSQHLAAAIFRSIENRRSFVRVGNGGYSAVIDPNGEIIYSMPVLTRGQITVDVPVYSDKLTFYTRYGNIFDKFVIVIFCVIVVYTAITSIHPALLAKKRGAED